MSHGLEILNGRTELKNQGFYDLADVLPNTPRLLMSLDDVFEEVRSKTLVWHNWSADHRNVLFGEWHIANIYRSDTIAKGRRQKPRPKMESHRDMKKWINSVRALSEDFPIAKEIFEKIPAVNFVGLSRLGPKSYLQSHSHNNPDALVCHVGVDIPPEGDVGIEVDGEERTWFHPRQVIVFDDCLPHMAWNRSSQPRTVLHIDVEKEESGHT